LELIIDNISKKFDQEKVIFDKASQTFKKGKIYGLLGRNGTGKTTLFNCIAKEMMIDSGEIRLRYDNGIEEVEYDNTEVSYAYTNPNLPDFMTGYEFVQFIMDINAQRIKNPKSVAEYLAEIGIQKEDHHKLLKDYSHGMRNKVQMLVTMMIQTPVLLLDEPLTSFDVVAAHEIKQLILKQKESSIIIFSTHILQLAQDLCDEIILLHDKKLQKIASHKIHDQNFEEEIFHLLKNQNKGESYE